MNMTRSHRRRVFFRLGRITLVIVAVYLVIVYLIMPQLDRVKVHRHPDLVAGEHIARTGSGLPGDPLNVALVGSEDDVVRTFFAAGWVPAKPLSLASSVRIAVDTVLDKPDPNAPVSSLYLFGRKEDLAFEKPVGHSPRDRHHIRLWRTAATELDRPLWIGSVTHDTGVELSHTTGQVTHHIAPDVDAERALLLTDLMATNQVADTRWIDSYQSVLQGRNGGGDPWHTDGRLPVITLAVARN